MDNNLYIGFNAITGSHSYSLSLLYKGEIFAVEFEKINKLKIFPNGEWGRFIPTIQREMFGNIDKFTIDKDKTISFKNYLDDTINELIKSQNIDFNIVDKIFTLNFPFDISVRGYEQKVQGYKMNNHHLFHAASSYYPSKFNESVILSMDHDGYDEVINGGTNVMHTIWYAKGNDIKNIYYEKYDPKNKQVGVGTVYNLHSRICRIGEGTLMGLSGYGNNKLDHVKIFDYSEGKALLDKQYFKNVDLGNVNGGWEVEDSMDDIIINNFRKIYSIESEEIPENIENSIYSDISDKVQTEMEEAILFLAKKAYDLTGCSNICIAGGVGLNIIANNRILKETKFENIFVQPACTDAGLSLGGLYYMYHNILGNKERILFNSPGIGLGYSDEEILDNLTLFRDKILFQKLKSNKYSEVAKLLKDNKIIGWFQGKGEFGPRALGFRSILASPILKEMRSRVNYIKSREQYRPLAPIILEDTFQEYLDTNKTSPYMTLLADVYDDKKNNIPSVVHIDGTARYQTVNKNQNEEVYNLLKEFKNISGESVLINTSFNQHDEPIISTPKDAIKMFLATDIDYLVIGDYLVSKEQKFKEYSFDKNIAEKNFENVLKKSKNNNIRGKALMKLLGISKLGFNYNYNIGDKGIKLNYKGILEVVIELKGKNIEYYRVYNSIGIKINKGGKESEKILSIILFFMEKNSDSIYNLIKGI